MDATIVLDSSKTKQVEEYIKTHRPNVFFLDIDFHAEKSGIELASIIHEKIEHAYIVFISQYTNLVFKSFKVRPFDFLPKPVSKDDLENVLLEIQKDKEKSIYVDRPECLSIKIGNQIYQIPKQGIIFFEKFKNKCIIHSVNKTIYCYQSLDMIFEKLEDPNFIRCHKSYIVNKTFIEKIDMPEKEIILHNGQKCYIGGKFKKDLITEVGMISKG
jgi:two-component system response regulator AgrA